MYQQTRQGLGAVKLSWEINSGHSCRGLGIRSELREIWVPKMLNSNTDLRYCEILKFRS